MLELNSNQCLAVNGAGATTVKEIHPDLIPGYEIVGWTQTVTMNRVYVADLVYMDYPTMQIAPIYEPISIYSYM
jgi:hypothetical protein